MLTEPSVNPAMVTLAREVRGLSQSALAKTLNISQGHLSKIEAGLWPATDELLEHLVEKLDFPSNFFFQREPVFGPGVSEFYHRKRQDVGALLLRQVYASLNLFLIHLSRLVKAVDPGPCTIPRLDREDFKSVDEIARATRAIWHLPPGPVADVVGTIEGAGGIVVRCSFGTPRIDAISRWIPGLPPVFFVNDDIPADRERLTLCHELAHLIMHESPTPEMEAEANRFAAEFLMPERDIRPHFDRVTVARLAELKPYWKVAMSALLYRAADLGRVSQNSARYLWMHMSKAGYKRREPPELDVPREQPRTLAEIFQVFQRDLGYSLTQLAALLTLREDQVVKRYGLRASAAQRPRFQLIK